MTNEELKKSFIQSVEDLNVEDECIEEFINDIDVLIESLPNPYAKGYLVATTRFFNTIATSERYRNKILLFSNHNIWIS